MLVLTKSIGFKHPLSIIRFSWAENPFWSLFIEDASKPARESPADLWQPGRLLLVGLLTPVGAADLAAVAGAEPVALLGLEKGEIL